MGTESDGVGATPAPRAGQPPRAPRALRDAVAEFVRAWTAGQALGWDAKAASELTEVVESLAHAADSLGNAPVAEAAIELAVYLCSFVDGGPSPNGAQRATIESLVDRLRVAALGAAPAVAAGAPKAAPPRHRVVFYVRPVEREIAGLAAQLGRQGYVVRPFTDPGAAVVALDEAVPDVLVVDDAALTALHPLMLNVERARRETAAGRTVCLVVGAQPDAARRLFAQRSGADATVDGADAVAIATRIDELVAQQRAQHYRVLVVEDDRQQAMFCQSVLQHRGMATRWCAHPNDVADAIEAFKPDLVLLDLYLPDANGIEVAQRIRERPEAALLPIVFLSGEQDLDTRFDAIRMGGDDFITKPIKPRHLIALVESRIRRARALTGGGADERSGRRGALVGRAAFVAELERRGHAAEGPCLAVLIAVDDESGVRDRAGFVGASTLAQQVAAALAAEPALHAICSAGEFAWLAVAHGDDEAALRDRLAAVRDRLAARPWGASEPPLALQLTLVGVRPGSGETGEATVRKARELARRAQADGGARTVWDLGASAEEHDPRRRLVRTLLRGQLLNDALRTSFLPLIPLRGELTGQYVARWALVPPKARQTHEIDAATMIGIARELHVVPALQRHCIRCALRTLAVHAVGDGAALLRLFLPIEPETMLETAFAPWLAAELRTCNVPAAALALVVDGRALLHDTARATQALRGLQITGVRLVLSGCDGSPELARLARLAEFDTVCVPAPDDPKDGWVPSRGKLVAELVRHGKLVVATGANEARDIGALLKLGIHYLLSDRIAPWSAEPNFDFAAVRLR